MRLALSKRYTFWPRLEICSAFPTAHGELHFRTRATVEGTPPRGCLPRPRPQGWVRNSSVLNKKIIMLLKKVYEESQRIVGDELFRLGIQEPETILI